MSKNERYITRIRGIYYFLRKEGTSTTRTMAEEFGVNIKTIQSDLRTLEYHNKVENLGQGKWKAVG